MGDPQPGDRPLVAIGAIRHFRGINAYADRDVVVARLRGRLPGDPPAADAALAGRTAEALRAAGTAIDAATLPAAGTGVDLIRAVAGRLLAEHGLATADALALRPAAAVDPWEVVIPLEHGPSTEEILRLATDLVAWLAVRPADDALHGRVAAQLSAIAGMVAGWRPDLDQAEIIGACRRLGVRWRRLASFPDCIQLGEGRRQRRLLTAITGETGFIAVRMASDKTLANRHLAEQGVPVPRHRVVASADEAGRAAAAFGLPVVVKPRDGRWNRGVSVVFIGDEIPDAFAAAQGRGTGGGIIVEKYVPGREYRILVAAGAVCAVYERVAPVVVGDGRATVAALIAAANADPARLAPADAWSGPIVVQPAVERCLAWQGLGLDRVPAAGRTVLVNPLPFRKHGGTYRDTSDGVHPENAALAVRIARLMGLEIAGIDIRMADIGQPWQDGPAGVCEVNAGPGLDNIAVTGRLRGVDVPGRLVDRILPPARRGPLPFILFATTGPVSPAMAGRAGRLAAALGQRHGWTVALAGPDELHVGTDRLRVPPRSGAAWAVDRILEHPEADAALLVMPKDHLIGHGIGHDRIDLALVEGGPYGGMLGRLLAEAGTRLLPFDADDAAILAAIP
ncbi:D-alanine-D-alanine ligase-like ATP-grasp enzyme [Stella humosa]|uniref:D-alanine-D-alanine ligase-like ATP-grasp enzyme n=1 Tax=Stella humosa TaxID=94 RepID=A0A3N1MB92_9PROT|nr:ATP-grasp domain-containing protein [Stella humosa]ROP99966.1 D-alanine-D-alanine ligase-like ATP-grasp enzyme [Stella humosa]BBK30803.1 hypothetical protein STHU_14370 [Stella humosa]